MFQFRTFITGVLLGLAVCCHLSRAQEVVPDQDGPYVFWHDSTEATVFYLCQGEIREKLFEDVDTLRFRCLCREEGLLHTVPATPPTVEPDTFTDVPKIFAVSDIHGAYEAMVDILKVTGIVDSSLLWNWGDGHLVVNGDVFDRGDGVTEALWLIYRLEQEARQVGGRVHFTLGNHELMVLRDDNRYVHEKYLKGIAKKSRILHQDLYGPDMELGRWLRTKHTMIQLNDILFVHGGISPEMIERGLSVSSVNESVRVYLDLRSSQVAFSDEPKFLFGSRGPFWERGFLIDMEDRYERLTGDQVAEVLAFYNVSSVVVGHTEMDRVDSYYGGLVYSLDVPIDELGALQGLLWEDNRFFRVTGTGKREVLE